MELRRRVMPLQCRVCIDNLCARVEETKSSELWERVAMPNAEILPVPKLIWLL